MVTLADRGQFLLDYMLLLLNERVNEADGFRHVAPGTCDPGARPSNTDQFFYGLPRRPRGLNSAKPPSLHVRFGAPPGRPWRSIHPQQYRPHDAGGT